MPAPVKRARLNLVIDAVIGGAFLVTAVTGVIFLLPPAWQQTLLVGLSFHAWHWLHDWSGVVAAAGVALHLALHWRWVVHTARRWLAEASGERQAAPSASRGRQPARSPSGELGATGAAAPVAQTAMARYTTPTAEKAREQRGRVTRRGFLIGAAGFAAAVAGGVGLARIASAVNLGDTSGTSSAGQGSGAASSGTAGSAGGTTGSSSAGTGTSGGGTTTTAARVVVDSSSCIACGHCLQVCPKSVFAWNGSGRATAQSPQDCILCRRCVSVCPASAITLNA
jgi:NAD-dependent dihydropyrimidine dehydrogenase PreA subunit